MELFYSRREEIEAHKYCQLVSGSYVPIMQTPRKRVPNLLNKFLGLGLLFFKLPASLLINNLFSFLEIFNVYTEGLFWIYDIDNDI